MIQQIILFSIFIAAMWYLGRIVFRSFNTKEGCEKDCKCEPASEIKITKGKPS